MADEDLTASHWDDVYTESPFGSKLPNILQSDEFAPPKFDDSPTQSKHDESHSEEEETTQSLHDNTALLESPYDKQNYDSSNVYNSPDLYKETSKSAESKVKNQSLLTSLTKDIDEAPLGSSAVLAQPAPVNKGESLFNQSDSLDSKFREFSAVVASNDTHSPPKKVTSVPVKMYRAPRARRSKANGRTSAETSFEPLGPLGESLEKRLSLKEEKEKQQQVSPAAQLVQSADAPLYNLEKEPPVTKKLTDNPTITTQIGDYFQKKEQDKYQKSLPKRPEPEAGLEKIEINVGDPTKVGDLTSAHIVYTIRSATESGLLTSSEVVVTRRYRDFRWLFHQLQSNNPGYIIPPPPLKQAVGRFNEQFIESRRYALERMLQKISLNATLQKDPDFLMFLQSSNFSAESKEREKITGSGASNAGDDYELPGGSSGSSSSGGFMSALGGAFSFSTKVTDQDDFFLDMKTYIEDLDIQLRAFHKGFEAIVQQRNELSSLTEEFSVAVMALADVETSKSSVTLLTQFAETQHRIKELLERQSMQDLITLGSVLDEYIRILGSIRAVFAQRHKALVASTNASYELGKKQTSLDKFVKNHRNQVEKIEVLKKEVAVYENKSITLKDKFDTISNTIKKELNRFEFEKVDDLRNSVETFLESLIESQKEAIELWETFYERQKLDEVEDVNFEDMV